MSVQACTALVITSNFGGTLAVQPQAKTFMLRHTLTEEEIRWKSGGQSTCITMCGMKMNIWGAAIRFVLSAPLTALCMWRKRGITLFWTTLTLWFGCIFNPRVKSYRIGRIWIVDETPVGKEKLLLLSSAETACVGSDPVSRLDTRSYQSPPLFGNLVLCNAMLNKTFPYVHYPELKTRAYQRLRGHSVTKRVWARG